jgi:methionine-rich copper-binding protein CopC
MQRLSTRIAPVALLALALTIAARPAERHLRLVKAEPAVDGVTTTAPTALRLHYSEAPQLRATSAKLSDAAENVIEVGEIEADEKESRIIIVPVKDTVAPGVYTVAWRAMGSDGHVLSGTYKFTYKPAR